MLAQSCIDRLFKVVESCNALCWKPFTIWALLLFLVALHWYLVFIGIGKLIVCLGINPLSFIPYVCCNY